MELDELWARIDSGVLEEARNQAWATAAGTGEMRPGSYAPSPRVGVIDVAHELADHLWDMPEVPLSEKVDAALELYRQMPNYGFIMYATHHYADFDEETKGKWWRGIRELLDHEDARLADPILYLLWVDFFEDRQTVEEAWVAVMEGAEGSKRRMERLIENSGPVPWGLKGPLYESLTKDPNWHQFIFRGLLRSAFDVYGDIRLAPARQLLSKLELPTDAETDHLKDLLSRKLAEDENGKGMANRLKHLFGGSRKSR